MGVARLLATPIYSIYSTTWFSFYYTRMEVAEEVIKSLLFIVAKTISTELKMLYPNMKRERSVRRYVTKHNLRHVCETTLIEDRFAIYKEAGY